MSTQSARYVDQLDQLHAALSRPQTATVEETAAALVHAARGAQDPHTEAGRIVTGLFPEGNDYSRRLSAAIEALRPLVFVAAHSHSLSDGWPCTRTDVARIDGATNYGRALDAVYDVRAEAGDQSYGVIDTVYGCGCDSGAVYTSY